MRVNIEQCINNSAGSPKKTTEDFCKKLQFFTPYKDKNDFLDTLASPVVEPLRMMRDTLGCALYMVGFAAGAVVALSVAVSAVAFNRDLASFALYASGLCIKAALLCAAATLLSALFTVGSFCTGVVSNLTRGGVTIRNAVRDLCAETPELPQAKM